MKPLLLSLIAGRGAERRPVQEVKEGHTLFDLLKGGEGSDAKGLNLEVSDRGSCHVQVKSFHIPGVDGRRQYQNYCFYPL